jgi:hypothetical protein
MGARNIMDGFNTITFEDVSNLFKLIKWGNISVTRSIEEDLHKNNLFQTKGLNQESKSAYKVSSAGFLQFEKGKNTYEQSQFDGFLSICTVADELIIDFKVTVYKGWIKQIVCEDIHDINFNFSLVRYLH